MRIRLALVLGVVAALVVAAVAVAAPTPYKITGGGQVLAAGTTSSGAKGPGDTITFQAQTPDQGEQDATGSVKIIDRTGTGKNATRYFGEVECVFLASNAATGGGYAELQGHGTTQSGAETPFVVRIQDDGQGGGVTDMVEFDRTAGQPDCGEDSQGDEFETALARGNAKIHKQSPSQSGSQQSGSTSTSSPSLTSATSLLR